MKDNFEILQRVKQNLIIKWIEQEREDKKMKELVQLI